MFDYCDKFTLIKELILWFDFIKDQTENYDYLMIIIYKK